MAHHPGATYLLSNGQIASGGNPVCFQTHDAYPETPVVPGVDNDGLWAEVPDEDPTDLSATRVIAWLSPEGEQRLRERGELHTFRSAIRARHQDAQVLRYSRGDGGVARQMVMILERE